MQSVNKRKTLPRRMVPHDKFIERIRKSFYFGNDSLTDDLEISRPLAEYSAEVFSEAHRGHSLNRLHFATAGSVHATPCSLLLALIYLDRLNNVDPTFLRRITPQELFIVSMMISTKFHRGHDEQIYVGDWAEDGNISEKRLKRLELEFLGAIDWNVYVSNEQFFEKLEHVELELARRVGLKRGWLTYTELVQMLPSLTLAKFLIDNLTFLTIRYTASLITLASALLMLNQMAVVVQNSLATVSSRNPTEVSNTTTEHMLVAQCDEGDAEVISERETLIVDLENQTSAIFMAEELLNEGTNEDNASNEWNGDYQGQPFKSNYLLDTLTFLYQARINNETHEHHSDKPAAGGYKCSDKYPSKHCLLHEIFADMLKLSFESISIF